MPTTFEQIARTEKGRKGFPMKSSIGPVEKLLRKAKAWLNSPKRLVRDWGNEWEGRNGKCLDDFADPPRAICRACILGAVSWVGGWDDCVALQARQLLVGAGRSKDREFSFSEPHTLGEVHAVYDKAIILAHKEGL